MTGLRAIALVFAVLLVLFGIGSCGGEDTLAPETPGEPASMPIPESPEPPGGGDSADEEQEPTDESAAPEEDSTTTEPGATEPGATEPGATEPGATEEGTTTEPPVDETGEAAPPETAAAPDESGGGATAPPTEADGPTNDTAPPAGSDAEQFEDFCAQNPGAC
jgi:hypothetical protein